MGIIWNYWNTVLSTLQEIESIKDPKEKEKIATDFVNGLIQEYSQDHTFIIDRFLEIDSDVELIEVPKSLMDALKEAIFCYVNGQYLSTIASVGITSELFCVHIYKLHLYNLGWDRSRVKRRAGKFSQISQREKIDTLFSVFGVDEHICEVLHNIRKVRNRNIHPHNEKEYKSDAINVLQDLIDVLNMYSKGVSAQKQALEKVKKEKVNAEEIKNDSRVEEKV